MDEVAGRRRHAEEKKGTSGGWEGCLETPLEPFAVVRASAWLTPTLAVARVGWRSDCLCLTLINSCFYSNAAGFCFGFLKEEEKKWAAGQLCREKPAEDRRKNFGLGAAMKA